MRRLLCAVLGALLLQAGARAAGQDAAPKPAKSDASAEQDFERLLADDDAARAEVQRWRREKSAPAGNASGTLTDLEHRIQERLDLVNRAYLGFLRNHPDHARAHLSYGCFLNEREDEAGAQAQWEKALELDPTNADAYNNLAGRYAEVGPARKAFEFYGKAIELKPGEPVYYHNFADALYVMRRHAMTNYGLSEQQVFEKSLRLYSNAAKLDPQNFTFARDWAQTYYALKPLACEQALLAWTNTLNAAREEPDREEVYVHLARVKMLAGRLGEARLQLNLVTNQTVATLKTRLLQAIEEREKAKPAGTR